MRRFDLRSLHFDQSGETWRRLPVEVEPFVFGGLDYVARDGAADLLLTASRIGGSVTLVAEVEAQVTGPCQRCLGDADIAVCAHGVEYVQSGDSPLDEDAEAGYVAANVVDVERWVRDLIAEGLSGKLLCSEDCAGLCSTCGADLNADPDHRHEAAEAPAV
ncbi:MAG TPA: DUF177 domain-containing protein [Thermoleophilia bacterium]|nr:DUF177 domain-containing protein [Thermoleophilia bacterium]